MIDQKTIEWIKNNQTVCVSPYSCLEFKLTSAPHNRKLEATCCCNLAEDTDSTLNIDRIKRVGQEMAAGIRPNECKICWDTEKTGGRSERMKYLVSTPIEKLKEFAQTRKTNEFSVKAKFSNKCNLACRSCNPYDSNFWATTMGADPDPQLTMDLSNDPLFWSTFTSEILENIEKYEDFSVHPIGGETLITDGFKKLIYWAIDQGIADRITLKLTTSLAANISDEFWQAFEKFKKVEFLASIDSVGDNYHCVRWPAKFSKVESNLAEIIRRNQNQKFRLYLTPVFSLNNIFYAEDYLDWWESWADENHQQLLLYNTYLYEPPRLMVEVLPEKYWPYLKDLVSRCVNHSIFKKHPESQVLWSFFNELLSAKSFNNDELWDKYLKFSAEYDVRTNTNILTLNAKLFDLLTPEDHLKIKHLKETIKI
jgi:hypothetical protein